MPALTWRNVDAPDFRTSLDGIRTFGDLVNSGVNNLNRGLERYDNTLDERANSAALLNTLKFSDPESYKAALASGTVLDGIDPRRLNATTIAALGQRQNDLQGQAISQLNLDQGKYTFDRTKTTDSSRDAAAPMIQGYLAAAANGQDGSWITAHPDAFKGLTFNDQVNLFKDVQTARTNQLGNDRTTVGIAGDKLRNDVTAWDFQNNKQDRADLLKVQDVVGQLAGEVSSAADFDRVAGKYGLTGRQSLLARQMLASSVPGLDIGGGAGGVGGSAIGLAGGGGGDPTRVITSGGAGNLGIGAVPPNVQTMGQAVQFGKQLNKAGQASSAMGVYQITQSTMEEFGAKALGSNWQSQPFDFNSQDKIAQQIFESAKGNPAALQKRWVSLSPKEAAAIAKLPWEQARLVIAKGESGADPSTLALTGSTVNQGVRNQFMQNNVAGLSNEAWQKAQADTSAPVAIATQLTGKGGIFEGGDQGKILGNIQDIQSRASKQGVQLSAAAAAQVLQNSTTRRGWGDWALGDLSSTNLGNGRSLDMRTVDSQIQQLKTGANQQAAVTNDQIAFRQQQIQTAQQQYQAAQQRYQQLIQAQRVRPNLDPTIVAQARHDLVVASNALQAAQVVQGRSVDAAAPTGTSFYGTRPNLKPAPVAKSPAPAMKSTISEADWNKMVAARDAGAKPAPQGKPARVPLPFESWNTNIPASLRR